MANINKIGRRIGRYASKAGRTLNSAYKAGRKYLKDVENTPVIGQAVKELEKRTGADTFLQGADQISDAIG